MIPPGTPVMVYLVGRIALSWSYIDQDIDFYAEIFRKKNGTPKPVEHARLSFAKRKAFFLQEMRTAYSTFPTIVSAFETLAGEVATLFWKRNILLHGQIISERIFPQNEFFYIAYGRHNGQPVELRLGIEELKELAARIEHAATLFKEPASMNGLTSPDIYELRDFRRKNPPNFPT